MKTQDLFASAVLLAFVFQVTPENCKAADAPAVSIVSEGSTGPASAHGLTKLEGALRDKSTTFELVNTLEAAKGDALLVLGLGEGAGVAARMLSEENRHVPKFEESLMITRARPHRDKPTWVVAGSDDRGLMYAELETAERVNWGTSGAALSEVRETIEQPSVTTRAVSIYTMNRAYWESRFYDEAYWAAYLDVLAQNRFNSLVVVFGYENGGFLAPCYPYFFDVPEFPDVQMVGITPKQQERNLAALNRLIEMAHQRGVQLTLGIWDHIYRGGVQGGGIPGADEATKKPMPGFVWGVTAENLVPYTKAALSRFLHLVPAVDAIQFRMHDESGLKNTEQRAFWRDVFAMVKHQTPTLRLDLRAKGLPDSVIQDALDLGVNFRITTKYWMEQMGLPFHPAHINTQDQQNRRHSYADLLRYPRQYEMHWRLWNGGTARVLLWSDPDYARRFVQSTHLYDGDGFEVNEPLCTKMEAQPHDAGLFDLLNEPHRYYQYEFERYWHFFQVFGRVGYDTNTSSEVWDREFTRRFGQEAGPLVESALHSASWVLPRIVASCYPYSYFPMTRGWAEKQRLGDLPLYAKAEGSDTAVFANFDEEARLLLAGEATAKTRPSQTSRWFADVSQKIQREVDEAEHRVGQHRTKEFDSTITDLKILANLALYHARRIPAAVNYRLFERTGAAENLDDAIRYEAEAVAAWQKLVGSAGDFYNNDLRMGVRGAGLCGHWKDELEALQKGLISLREKRSQLSNASRPQATVRYSVETATADQTLPTIIHEPVIRASPHQGLSISAIVRDTSGVKSVHLRYRPVNQRLDYQTLLMARAPGEDNYRATIPAEQIDPKWDLMYFIEAIDEAGKGVMFPNQEKETPYIIVHLDR